MFGLLLSSRHYFDISTETEKVKQKLHFFNRQLTLVAPTRIELISNV